MSQERVLVCLWVVVVSFLLVGILGVRVSGAEVSLFLSKNVTPFFCHPNLWD